MKLKIKSAAIATSIALALLSAAPASAHDLAPHALPADLQTEQMTVKSALDRVQSSMGKVAQDVLNIQANQANGNNAFKNMIYQASLAANIAKLSSDGTTLSSSTKRLQERASSILAANDDAMKRAGAKIDAAVRSNDAAAKATAELELQNANTQAILDQKAIFGTLLPTVTAKVQTSIGKVAKSGMKVANDYITGQNTGMAADKAALLADVSGLMADFVEMTNSAQTTSSTTVKAASTTQPVGGLMITQANGQSVSLAKFLSSLISGGAFGNLAALQAKLANYTVVDAASHKFSVDLSGMVKAPSAAASLNAIPTENSSDPAVMKLADGSEVAYMQAAEANSAESLGFFGLNPEAPKDMRVGYAMLTDKTGTTTAIGYGFPVQFSYAKALYGNDDIAQLSSQLGVSNLSSLAQGGGLFAYGMKLNDSTRMAVSWSGSAAVVEGSAASWNPAWANTKATNIGIGLTHKFNDQLTGGLNVGFLNESHGMLGSTYESSSAMSLGETNRTTSLGFAVGLKTSETSSLMVEAGFARTKGGETNGLFAGTTDVQSRSYGMTFMSKHLFKDEDRLIVSMKQPLRVVSGQVAMVMANVDAEGNVSYGKEMVSLVPTGREIDYKMSYDIPLKRLQSLTMQASARKDVLNIAGNSDVSAGVSWKMKF